MFSTEAMSDQGCEHKHTLLAASTWQVTVTWQHKSYSFTTGELDNAMKQLAEHYFEPDQHDPQDIADADEASDEGSDDDPEVDTLLDHALNSTSTPPICW